MLRDEIGNLIADALLNFHLLDKTTKEIGGHFADRIIALLDKEVQDSGWKRIEHSSHMGVEGVHISDEPASWEEVIKGKATLPV